MMAAADIFLMAQYTQPARLCGLRVRPFSLHHAAELELLGSPYVKGGPRTMADLVTLALVCRDDSRAPLRSLSRFGWLLKARVSIALCTARRVAAEMIAAQTYIDRYCAGPSFWQENGKTRSRSGVTWPVRVAYNVIRSIGCSRAEAWDMPVNEALVWSSCAAEDNGEHLADAEIDEAIAALQQEHATRCN